MADSQVDRVSAKQLHSLTRQDIEDGLALFRDGKEPHSFKDSTRFDLLVDGSRYPPKAIVGLAARRALERTPRWSDFTGGESSSAFRLLWSRGFEMTTKPHKVADLDATFSVARTQESTFIYFESRGPNRNKEYLEGLEDVLSRLRDLNATLVDVLVDSRETVGLDEGSRRVDPGLQYPIPLARIDDVGDLRRALTQSAAETARADASAGGGNPTKRLRLQVEVPAKPLMIELATVLSGSRPQHVLNNPAFDELIEALNDRATEYEIGRLQQLRKDLKDLRQAPGKKIFGSQSIHLSGDSPYAHHLGGRPELQFNVGIEHRAEGAELRHGVAFSFEPSQSLQDPEGTLLPKMRRFNEFVHLHPDFLEEFWFWWRDETGPSLDEPVRPIPSHLAAHGFFLFVGKRQSLSSIDLDAILADFDRLLPLYLFVEGTAAFPDETIDWEDAPTGLFEPGHTKRVLGSRAVTQAEKELEVRFRHNEMQDDLNARLVSEFGEKAVGTEQRKLTGKGTAVDLVVSTGDGYDFYEIKTALSARACLREAVSQLLEYSYWPGSTEAAKLIVVGESEPDDATQQYVEALRDRFGLPLYYESMSGTRV